MKTYRIHNSEISITQAIGIQQKLSNEIFRRTEFNTPRFIGGVDMSGQNSEGTARAAVVVLSYPELEIIEVKTAEDNLVFPYIPGLLSFREAPLILAAFQKLSTKPELVIVDGQGIAHPRRLGLASHLGLLLDISTIGCAKSRLCGWHEPLESKAGTFTDLVDNDETIGAVVRTKTNVKPVYVSIGHRIDLPTSIHWTMECCRGYRLPEPTRLAHLAAGGKLAIKANVKGKRT